MFEHGVVHKCTWYQNTLGQRSMIDFVVVSSDLWPHILDTRLKRGAELSANHRLMVSWIRCWGRLPGWPGTPKHSEGERGTRGRGLCLRGLQLPTQPQISRRKWMDGWWHLLVLQKFDWMALGVHLCRWRAYFDKAHQTFHEEVTSVLYHTDARQQLAPLQPAETIIVTLHKSAKLMEWNAKKAKTGKHFTPVLLLCCLVQSAEEKVPVWYVMDEFGSQVQHSDQPSCAMAPFFYIQGQLAYSVLWPLQDLREGGESRHTSTHTTQRVRGHLLLGFSWH